MNVVITGAGGFLGKELVELFLKRGMCVHAWDISLSSLSDLQSKISKSDDSLLSRLFAYGVDVTDEKAVSSAVNDLSRDGVKIEGLINNATINPKMLPRESGRSTSTPLSTFENFDLGTWRNELEVGLTGAFICTKAIGGVMAASSGGVIVNVASDLALIGPDQRIYGGGQSLDDIKEAKPVTYSVIKSGLIGLTRYTATYWARNGVRCNAVCPGGIENHQDPEFVKRLTNLIPLGRMAECREIANVIFWLMSDESSYVHGAVISADGGRTAW